MKISKRLQTIADMISEGEKVIDVGCDHALLDIYLSNYKNCLCVAADINSNALEQAKYNIKRAYINAGIREMNEDICAEKEVEKRMKIHITTANPT